MPPRVNYWTGIWEPHREAISKEVACLRAALAPTSRVVSFSHGQRSEWPSREGVWRLSHRRWLLLRLLARVFEPRAHLNHVFGAPDEWHLLRGLGRRPTLFTAALPMRDRIVPFAERVTLFVAESQKLRAALTSAGVPEERVRVVYPGVDLEYFIPSPPPASTPFRLLFASAPADPAEFARRGIHLIVDLARTCPDVEVRLLWRCWGDARGARDALTALAPPDNVVVDRRDAADMADVYRTCHAVVLSYEEGFGKVCPASVVEALACGRPALVSDTCGVSDVITERGAGVVVARNVEGLADGLSQLRTRHAAMSLAARAAAESHFDLRTFIRQYENMYCELATN